MINILIVDDSPTDVAILKHLFSSLDDMCIVGTASNGIEAIALIKKLKPDIVTMDLMMPEMNGYDAIKSIMSHCPVPIVVVSSALDNPTSDARFKAIEAGALYVLDKPKNIQDSDFLQSNKFFIDIVRTMSEVNVIKKRKYITIPQQDSKTPNTIITSFELVAIGASAGGPQALTMLLSQLEKNFPLPIIIVQHMSVGFINGFANWLDGKTALRVKVAEDNESIESGVVYLAEDHYHLTLVRRDDKLIIKYTDSPPVSGFKPSVTVMIESVAKATEGRAIGILLSGMGSDGASGLRTLHNMSGYTMVQDAESSVVFGMGSVALKLNAVDDVVSIKDMAFHLKDKLAKSDQ